MEVATHEFKLRRAVLSWNCGKRLANGPPVPLGGYSLTHLRQHDPFGQKGHAARV